MNKTLFFFPLSNFQYGKYLSAWTDQTYERAESNSAVFFGLISYLISKTL